MSKFPKVKILRAEKREGLIKARLRGTEVATAPTLTFLDSHIECAPGWLEPLLDRIARNETNVASPVIDSISDETFRYNYASALSVAVGGFDWSLKFNWQRVPDSEHKRRKNPAEPVRTPTIAGGLFTISKSFFERVGTYDPGFDIWGGENLEISFKTWMCGGTLEIIPCSHVGHVFRFV
jgi:polypeptide N-acetylgalactosaminyltransferase